MKAYAIKDPNGNIILTSICTHEEQCKKFFDEDAYFEEYERKGYHCVPVEVKENKIKSLKYMLLNKLLNLYKSFY